MTTTKSKRGHIRYCTDEMMLDPRIDKLDFSGKACFMHLLITNFQNLSGCFRMSYRQLAAQIGLSEESYRITLGHIEEAGLIMIDHETDEVLVTNYGKYQWSSSPKTVTSIREWIAAIESDKLREIVSSKLEEFIANKKRGIPKDTKDFDEWWAAYPSSGHREKTNCTRMYYAALKAEPDLTPEVLMKALEFWKTTHRWVVQGYILNSTTWLNGCYWQPERIADRLGIEVDANYRRLDLPATADDDDDDYSL